MCSRKRPPERKRPSTASLTNLTPRGISASGPCSFCSSLHLRCFLRAASMSLFSSLGLLGFYLPAGFLVFFSTEIRRTVQNFRPAGTSAHSTIQSGAPIGIDQREVKNPHSRLSARLARFLSALLHAQTPLLVTLLMNSYRQRRSNCVLLDPVSTDSLMGPSKGSVGVAH